MGEDVLYEADVGRLVGLHEKDAQVGRRREGTQERLEVAVGGRAEVGACLNGIGGDKGGHVAAHEETGVDLGHGRLEDALDLADSGLLAAERAPGGPVAAGAVGVLGRVVEVDAHDGLALVEQDLPTAIVDDREAYAGLADVEADGV